ncbi:thiol-disulfide isomerase/thioredoxin [Pedobacter cryoconitis]|uniref:Thiol-disulfide isomerase/thioredoxin n=2 Tax=Pedobacter cryoconitis TaxID=188932 RepID=A0A327RXM7_9SPHI|nr:thiol-disulfide isomerase/thioredoxin [Pedobacter cryoconitis]
MATLCLFFSAPSQAQTVASTFKPVKIGGRIPDVTITNVYNYESKKTNLSDFKAKLIILDFWATSCTSCLANFTKTEELQKKYGGEVQFIKVTNQPRKEVLSFLEKLHKTDPSTIPVVTNDSALYQLFPHINLPHYVWLDQTGKVVATTTTEQLTVENIDHFLSNDNIGNMHMKVDMNNYKSLTSSLKKTIK